MPMTDLDPKFEQQTEMLKGRLRKNRRRLSSWISKVDTDCYRLYDRDIPEIPLTVDWYDGRLYLCSYKHSDREGEEFASRWLGAMGAAVAEVLGVEPSAVYTRMRERKPGGEQYDRLAEERTRFVVHEAGLKFWVNLSDYLDTGLFLDHRNARRWVREQAQGARVLNLFAYTGSFSVYAAAGGARETLTVDLSARYLRWAEENMKLNGFVGPEHSFLRKDAVGLLESNSALIGRDFDLVVVDPPTISKSKRMEGSFDVQRDHGRLLQAALGVCRPRGMVFFSTNFRGFKLDEKASEWGEVEEITDSTLPHEFRNRKIHRSFVLRTGDQT